MPESLDKPNMPGDGGNMKRKQKQQIIDKVLESQVQIPNSVSPTETSSELSRRQQPPAPLAQSTIKSEDDFVSEALTGKDWSQFALDLLSHLYSGQVEYQSRILEAYYHPNLAVFQDQFVAVGGAAAAGKSRQSYGSGIEDLRRLFALTFGWTVREVDVELVHVSASPSQIAVAQQPSGKVAGTSVLIEYNLRTRELSMFGKLLQLFRLLPPPVLMSYSPRSACSSDGHKALRIVTKLDWIPDSHAPSAIPSQQDNYRSNQSVPAQRGYIVLHENIYSPVAQNGLFIFYPFFWVMMMLSVLAFILQTVSFGLSGLLEFLATSPRAAANIPPPSLVTLRNWHQSWKSNVPKDFEYFLKRQMGLVLVALVGGVESIVLHKRLADDKVQEYQLRKRGVHQE